MNPADTKNNPYKSINSEYPSSRASVRSDVDESEIYIYRSKYEEEDDNNIAATNGISTITFGIELKSWLEYEIEKLGSELMQAKTPEGRASYSLGKKTGRLVLCKEILSKIATHNNNHHQHHEMMTN